MSRGWYTAVMQRIHTKEIVIIAIALLVIIVVGIRLSAKHLKDNPLPRTHVATDTHSTPIKLVSFSGSYRRGEYTLDGALTVPTVCYVASAKSSLVPSTTPSVIRLDVTVPIDTGRCLQLPATTTFSVRQRSGKGATIHVYVNNALATSTII